MIFRSIKLLVRFYNIKNLIAALIILNLFTIPCTAEISHLPEKHLRKLINPREMSYIKIIDSVQAIPKDVLKICKEEHSDFALAEPGQEFQLTDIIRKRGLLKRRLKWVAITSNYLILHYEMGGIGHSNHIWLFSMNEREKFELIWKAVSISFENLNDFIRVLNGHGIDDKLYYYH